MLTNAWELLNRYSNLRNYVSSKYDCVIIDEFQDVNKVQSEVLDIITSQHHNYMAIGDDDQTIYEWRGANNELILSFEKRYGAKKYYIGDNFRCNASQIVLANSLIRYNDSRELKTLSLTKGFDGSTSIINFQDNDKMADYIVDEVKLGLQRGLHMNDIVVLIRLYSQTPPLELALTQAQIPYKVSGNTPFYKRKEIDILLSYLQLALVEKGLSENKPFSSAGYNKFNELWCKIANEPNRYLSKALTRDIAAIVLRKNISISSALLESKENQKADISHRMEILASLFKYLAANIDSHPANELIIQLETSLNYKDYLIDSTSSLTESGEAKASNVDSIISYAIGKGNGVQFLKHISELIRQNGELNKAKELLSIRTIYKAKGLEWELVFVPNCNDGIIPFKGRDKYIVNIEEERRLLYVAITRTKKNLHLLSLSNQPISNFFLEAEFAKLNKQVERIKNTLVKQPKLWSCEDKEALYCCRSLLNLDRFIKYWWKAEESNINEILIHLEHVKPDNKEPKHKYSNKKNELNYPVITKKIAVAYNDNRCGNLVKHDTFGYGIIIVDDDDKVTVDFETAGTKRLDLGLANLTFL